MTLQSFFFKTRIFHEWSFVWIFYINYSFGEKRSVYLQTFVKSEHTLKSLLTDVYNSENNNNNNNKKNKKTTTTKNQ